MKKIILSVLVSVLLIFSLVGVAEEHKSRPERLNKIHMNLSAEQWVETSMAKVVVTVDAVLDKAGLASTHQTMTNKLSQIAKADWHITTFNRSKDPSGLEKVWVQAEARLPENQLPGLRDKAEKTSKPGVKFNIANVIFEPSMADMENTRSKVRAELYEKAKQELARINSVYTDQQYFIHRIQFGGGPMPMPMPRQAKGYQAEMRAVSMVADASLTVSNKVHQSAYVVFGARVNDR